VPVVSCVLLSVPLLQDIILTAVVIVSGAPAAARVSAVTASITAYDNVSAVGVTNISDVPLLLASQLLLAFLSFADVTNVVGVPAVVGSLPCYCPCCCWGTECIANVSSVLLAILLVALLLL
jgi:hypothetical protein